MSVTEDKLNTFLGKAVGDLGASVSAVLMLIGDELGLYRRSPGTVCQRRSWRKRPGPTSVTSASGWRIRPPAAMWNTTKPATHIT